MKNVTIRMSDAAIAAAEKTYGAKVTGAQRAVESYFHLQRRTLESIGGRFTDNELCAIVDNMNGVLAQPEFMVNPAMLAHHLIDGNTYEGLFQKWELDAEAFLEKVKALTPAESFFLQDAAMRVWDTTEPIDSITKMIKPTDKMFYRLDIWYADGSGSEVYFYAEPPTHPSIGDQIDGPIEGEYCEVTAFKASTCDADGWEKSTHILHPLYYEYC